MSGLVMWIVGVVGSVIAGFAGHFGQAYLARYVRQLKRERAFARLKSEPLYRIGAVVSKAVDPTNGGVLCEEFYIAEWSPKRVLLAEISGPLELPMTSIEFEQLQVFIDSKREIGPDLPGAATK